ncbi:MAG: hypothetical protein AAFQ53_00490 [Bacteroidota bacterium]
MSAVAVSITTDDPMRRIDVLDSEGWLVVTGIGGIDDVTLAPGAYLVSFARSDDQVFEITVREPSRLDERSIRRGRVLRRPTLQLGPDDVVKQIQLSIHPDDAFRLFTSGIASWWPVATHSVSSRDGAAPIDIVWDDTRVYEVAPNGQHHDWGTVDHMEAGCTVWLRWHPGADVREATHVAVAFSAIPGGSRALLVHSGWRAGAASEAERDRYDEGWEAVFVEAFGSAAGRVR